MSEAIRVARQGCKRVLGAHQAVPVSTKPKPAGYIAFLSISISAGAAVPRGAEAMLGERQSLLAASWAAAVVSGGPGHGQRSTQYIHNMYLDFTAQAGLDAAQGWRALVFCCDQRRCTEA